MKKILFLFSASLFLACANPDQKADDKTEATNPSTLVTQEVSYQADGITMKGYLVYDGALEGERPGVIVVHEWWGHNEHSRNSAEKLANAGYVAFALDMYGDGKTAEHPSDAGSFAGAVMQNFDGAKARFNAAVETLKADPHTNKDHIAAIGYCFGGGVVLNMAREGAELDAVATFHGSLGAVHDAEPGKVKAKILVMNGEDDPFVSPETKANFKTEMDAAGVDYKFIDYPGAVHAFTNPDATEKGKKFSLPLKYNKAADKASWKELLKFLDEVWK